MSAAAPRQSKDSSPSRQAYLNLFKAGGELALLEGSGVVPDPLQQQQHKLPVFLPPKLQLLGAKGCVSSLQGLGVWASATGAPIPPLTLALTPSCAPGTRGMASYRDET